MNVVVNNVPEKQYCKDITIVQQIQTWKPGSNKIPLVLRNLSCGTLKVRKGMKIGHVEASNIVPTMVYERLSENVLQKEAGNVLKSTLQEHTQCERRKN